VEADRFVVEPLASHHDRAAFSSGVDALDDYLRRQAGQDARSQVATVFVLHDSSANRIVGYYMLSATAVTAGALPPEITRRLPRYPELPAVLIGRLAVDARYRDQGFGRRLLVDALRRAFVGSRQIAALAVVVDAKDASARSFYERYGFRSLRDDPRRLFRSMETIAELVAAP
jgi:ribosomal protein S18 acetylase RimI-like enzyme